MTTTTRPAQDAAPTATARSLGVVTTVLAVACGLSVANLYYAQPLLALLAESFHTSQGATAIVVTATQLGYALGLLFVLPLGDLLENRKLTARVLLGTAVALVIAGFAGDLLVFLVFSVLIGVTSVVAQILVPLAAHLAPEAERGRLVGRVMGGLLLGILLARTLSSLLAAALGWRSVFFISAGLMLALSVVLTRMLPERRPTGRTSYPRLLRSLGELVRTEPALRRRATGQALMFGAFSAFWTSITYELIDHHGLSQTGVGLFALVGAAGALSAPLAGWLGDHGYGRISSGIAIALGLAALLVADVGQHSLLVLAVGAVLLDLGVQGHQVLSQQEIYQLRPEARARVTTVHMTTIFLVGALSSAVSGALYAAGGWGAAMLFGAALPLVALVLWTGSTVLSRRRPVAAVAG